MASEYDLNLSDGTTLATLYPLEVNGPDNQSTPRQIVAVDTGTNHFEIVGDMTGRFIAGFQFSVSSSTGNDGTYTVDAGGSTFDGTHTIIPVTTSVSTDAVPLGQLQYVVLDPNTTLQLPGRGTVNWGEYFIDNFVHLAENFAAPDSPDTNSNIGSSPAGDPLRGQWWYNTTVNEEGFLYYDGTGWTRNYDLDDGALIFRDPENVTGPSSPNVDITITGSDPDFPDVGLAIRTLENPDVEESILRVLSQGGSEVLRVEHDGWTETTNNLEVLSHPLASNRSYVHGTLAIGGRPDGTTTNTRETDLVTDRTLTVQGNGIAVNSDVAQNAPLVLNSPAGMTSYIDFRHDGTLKGHISVNDATAGDPMVINAGVSNDVVMVTGGGNVGINQIAPSRTLDVVGESEFNGDVYVITSDTIFDNGYGLESVAGAQLKTGPGGGTWQTTPATNTAASFVANDSLSAPIFQVDETSGTRVLQHNFSVDTDTLYVDVINDRVGVNVVPSYDLDVLGNSHFDGRVGINNVPPSGTVWLEVTGDIQANSQFRGSNQSAANPTYSFTADPASGLYYIPASSAVAVATAGVERWRVSASGQTFSIDTTLDGDLTVNGTVDILDNLTVTNTTTDITSSGAVTITSSTNNIQLNAAVGTLDINTPLVDVSADLQVAGNVSFTGGTSTFTANMNNMSLGALNGITVMSDINASSNVLNFASLFLNEGGGNVSTGPDIRMAASGLMCAETSLRFNFDDDNDGNGEFYVSKGAQTSAATILFRIENDGTLHTDVTNYETQVTDDNDIPNKKYVDDEVAAVAPSYENQSAVAGGTTAIPTTVNTVAASGGKAFLQVFVNGVLQIETAGFTVTGANEITLTSPPATPFDVTIFSWR